MSVDNGDSGIGGPFSAQATYGITVISVNDAPQTFTYVAPNTGSYVFGDGVMNDKDQSVNSYLGIDSIRVNNAVVQSFENGLGTTATLGTVSVVTTGQNATHR